ncbi:ATP synthase F1 subunit delta [Peptacetobacter hominis]|uniref:ATP synthase subunit delta n=1 Tax=Peptacetobacter hominis TaxID=2743610 RepID=A0A544QTG5_9FIRM|nr:ATP synthase F1 subunit delta [Peptacetobacter hominis]TQQ83983.1 ATP synthase F1 subunit delta [Peptacetobacter hominis]
MIDETAAVYAKAMFDVSEEMGRTNEVLKQFSEIVETIEKNRELSGVMYTPFIKDVDKKEIIEKIFSETSDRYLLNFIKLLIDKKKTRSLRDIYNRFAKMVDEKNIIEKGIVISAVKLTDEEVRNLEEKLSKKFSRKVELENKVDESIIGGIFVKVGNREIDGTVKGRMKGLKKELSKMI